MVRLVWGRGGPEREPGRTGEYVTLGELMRPRETEPDYLQQLVADLVREYDPGGYRLQCPVAGCGWGLTVPRMELDPEPLEASTGDWTVRVEGVPREDVEAILRAHVELHAALTETVPVRNGPWPAGTVDWPLPPPPRWEQQEWCDGGTCEHEQCLQDRGPIEPGWRPEWGL